MKRILGIAMVLGLVGALTVMIGCSKAKEEPPTGNLLVAPFTEAKAKEVQKKVAMSLQMEVEEKADLGKSISLEMVLIPAGKFKMG